MVERAAADGVRAIAGVGWREIPGIGGEWVRTIGTACGEHGVEPGVPQ